MIGAKSYGPWAIIAGAPEGIGVSYCRSRLLRRLVAYVPSGSTGNFMTNTAPPPGASDT